MTMGKEDIVVEFSSDLVAMNVWRWRSVDSTLVSGLRLARPVSGNVRTEIALNRFPKKTDGRGQAIRLRDRCLVENLAQHF